MTATKTCLSGLFVLTVFLSSSSRVSGLGSVVSRYYTHVISHLSWSEAQSNCRRSYTGLATIYRSSDEDSISSGWYYAWIGLYRTEAGGDWAWSNGDTRMLDAWQQNEPQHSDMCAFAFYDTNRLYGSSCSEQSFFICHKEKSNRYEYTFIPETKSWLEARDYCRQHYDDLATFPYSLWFINSKRFPIWIGLHKDANDTWRWSLSSSDYTNWDNNEPSDDGDCVTISSTEKKMSVRDCSHRFPSLCMSDNVVVVKENKTWEDALEHCRTLAPPGSGRHYELLSVQPGADQEYVMVRVGEADTEEVWVSLRFLAGHWLWINQAELHYTGLPECPVDWQHCGVLSKANATGVEVRDCAERRNFLCYQK